MKNLYQQLINGETLNEQDAILLMNNITNGSYTNEQVASILTVFIMRPITISEITGFRNALIEASKKIDLSDFDPIDMCGTGGDSKNTFNISTISSIVVASCGIPVAKHGNYGVSSLCGSSNVLEELGVKFTTDESKLKFQLEKSGICFLHAPLFHPALKNVGPIRKSLGVKTFFNMLGPMVNPASPKRQVTGVFSLELARIYQYVFQNSHTNFSIIHTSDGYDEISLTNSAKVINHLGEKILQADSFGLKQLTEKNIHGGSSISEAAQIFKNVINNKGTKEQIDVVLANSAIAINTIYPKLELEECVSIAKEAIESGKTLKTMKLITEN